LAPFYRICGECHRTEAPFPPNFLAGRPETVIARVTQCATRIKYRLGMWSLDARQRPKTPMPPQHILSRLQETPESWSAGPQLAALQESLDEFVHAQGGSLPGPEALLASDYASLPACLPGT
jgi:hypothetical protein